MTDKVTTSRDAAAYRDISELRVPIYIPAREKDKSFV